MASARPEPRRAGRARRSLATALAIGLSALAAPAGAQDVVTAKALFTQGLADMEAGNFEKGCPALEGSHKLDPRPGTLFTLAECENKRGRLATAVARYDDYLSMVARMTPEQQRKQGDRVKIAREAREAIAPQVPTLTLTLPPDAPKGTVVKRDGIDLVEAALGVALPVDPRQHRVTTQAPGGEVTELWVALKKGENKRLALTVKGASAKAPAPAPKPAEVSPAAALPSTNEEAARGPSGQRVGAYVAGGVGAAGLILGGVMGVMALSKKSDVQKNCGFPKDPKGCNDIGLAEVSSARTMGTVSTVGFVAGAAFAITAVVLLLAEPKHAASSRGMRAGVLSAGRAGGTVGLEGVW